MTNIPTWKEIKRAIKKALRKCPESGNSHINYVHFWDIVYYLNIPLDKDLIMKLLNKLRMDERITYQVGFNNHLEDKFVEWGYHLSYVYSGAHKHSMKGIWKIIKFFRYNKIPCPLIGLREEMISD